jgi:hypothetical protein
VVVCRAALFASVVWGVGQSVSFTAPKSVRPLFGLVRPTSGFPSNPAASITVGVGHDSRTSLSSRISDGQSPRACFDNDLPVAGRPAFDPLLLVASGV